MSIATLNQTLEIEVALDLRQYRDRPTGAEDFLSLWDDLEAALLGQTVESGQTKTLEDPEHGQLRIEFLHVPAELRRITLDTPFAIHTVHEQPQITYACTVCREQKVQRYGPFVCQTCESENRNNPRQRTRLCDDHAVILDGSMMAFCPKHRPLAPDGQVATFWCPGPVCWQKFRGFGAWPDSQRRAHPHDKTLFYCPECYADLFPNCAASGCHDTGSNRCEFFDHQTRANCGQRLCNRHVKLWQIFGPNRRGLSLCPTHSKLRGLSDTMIAFQMGAACVQRRIWLPSLGTVRHILQNTRGIMYEDEAIFGLFEQLRQIREDSRLFADLRRAIENKSPGWRDEIDRGRGTKEKGRELFRRLQRVLHREAQQYSKLEEVRQALEFSDYRERTNLLFVKLPVSLRGLLGGPGGTRKRAFEGEIGCSILFEQLQG